MARKIKKEKRKLTRKVALIGFRGIGKSTLARELAALFSADFFSLDEEIEKEAGQRIDDIVNSEGWEGFRAREKKMLLQFAEKQQSFILDTGGGVVEGEDAEKIDALRKNFFCIYLYAPDEEIFSRLKASKKNRSRPDLPGGDAGLQEILERRKPLYRKVAHAMVDVSDCSAREAAARIVKLMKP